VPDLHKNFGDPTGLQESGLHLGSKKGYLGSKSFLATTIRYKSYEHAINPMSIIMSHAGIAHNNQQFIDYKEKNSYTPHSELRFECCDALNFDVN
tara:strand:- start:534 stop:818 length:285 start_codon:yes stop_codon:yes gene_type:complete